MKQNSDTAIYRCPSSCDTNIDTRTPNIVILITKYWSKQISPPIWLPSVCTSWLLAVALITWMRETCTEVNWTKKRKLCFKSTCCGECNVYSNDPVLVPAGCQYYEVHRWVYFQGPPTRTVWPKIKALQNVTTLEQRYEIPNRKYFTEKVMLRRQERRTMYSSLQRELCSPAMDGLQGPQSPYVTITAHFIDNEWETHFYLLQTGDSYQY